MAIRMPRVFPFENAAYFFLLASTLILEYSHEKIGIQLFLVLLMFIIEGAKPYHPIYIIIILLNFMQIKWIQIIFTAILTFYFFKYKFYDIRIINQGTYNAGFRNIIHNGQQMGVFYPTKEKGKPSLWIQTKDHYKKLYALTFLNPLKIRWIPSVVFKFFISFMSKITMPAQTNAKLEKIDVQANKYEVILFSHGLSANMTTHSSYCCWLASLGYIVISINHSNDLIRISYDDQFTKRKELLTKLFYLVQNNDLQIRTEQMKRVYFSLFNGKLLRHIFPQVENIGIKEILFFGHSLGGATCLQALTRLSNDQCNLELVKKVLCIDPYLFPMSQASLSHHFNQQITIINSQTFFEILPHDFKVKQLLKQFKLNNYENVKAFIIMGSDHVFSTDFSFVCGNGVSKITRCRNHNERQTFFSMLQFITRWSFYKISLEQIIKSGQQNFNFQDLKRKNVCIKQQRRYEQC